MLSFKSNRLTHIPEDALAPTIEWLILTDNLLEELPASIGCLKTLRKCMLTNNRLLALPDSLLQCLELIRLADNRLSDLPRGFWQLPKLAWAGLAGNPLVARAAPLPPPRWVAPAELEVGEQIGAGGGGFVHRAVWSAQPDEPVALKLFRDGHRHRRLETSSRWRCLTASYVVYAVGGDSVSLPTALRRLSSVERYDPVLNAREMVAPMGQHCPGVSPTS
mmetsp:Transcript_39715/g.131437  ORF Transcript_39715/g.131437 Transcript_39715/m.131437 type:complete len:220 (+) Transcript_39715:255-914(+)